MYWASATNSESGCFVCPAPTCTIMSCFMTTLHAEEAWREAWKSGWQVCFCERATKAPDQLVTPDYESVKHINVFETLICVIWKVRKLTQHGFKMLEWDCNATRWWRELRKTRLAVDACVCVCAGSFLFQGQRSEIRVACVLSAHWWTNLWVP